MDKLVDQIIVDILQREMDMPKDSVWIRDQNKKIPPEKGLYIVVGMVDGQPYSSQTYLRENTLTNGNVQTIEVNRVQIRENIQIDVVSRSDEAILRRWEVIAALRSIYSQNKQESNYFKIFRIPVSFLNTSDAEGGSSLNRYSITIPCFVWYKKEKVLSEVGKAYYDDFTTRVDDEQTIGTPEGIFEFEITPETEI